MWQCNGLSFFFVLLSMCGRGRSCLLLVLRKYLYSWTHVLGGSARNAQYELNAAHTHTHILKGNIKYQVDRHRNQLISNKFLLDFYCSCLFLAIWLLCARSLSLCPVNERARPIIYWRINLLNGQIMLYGKWHSIGGSGIGCAELPVTRSVDSNRGHSAQNACYTHWFIRCTDRTQKILSIKQWNEVNFIEIAQKMFSATHQTQPQTNTRTHYLHMFRRHTNRTK